MFVYVHYKKVLRVNNVVKVKLFANLRDIVGKAEIDIEVREGATLRDLLTLMMKHYGAKFENAIKNTKSGELTPFLIRVNNNVYPSTELDVKLQGNEKVALLIPVSGGLAQTSIRK